MRRHGRSAAGMLRCRARADPARLSPCAPAAHRRRPVRARAGARASGRARRRRRPDPLLQLVEGPAGARSVPGAVVVDARIPVSVLNFAWHRLEWPPVERLAGPVDIAHSAHPLLMPARRARQGRHHPRPRLPRSPGADARGNPARLSSACRAPCPPRRPGGGDLGAHRARRSRRGLACRPTASSLCRPGAPPAVFHRVQRRRPGQSCSSAPSSRARTCRRCSRPTSRLVAATPAAPPLVLAGRRVEQSAAILERSGRHAGDCRHGSTTAATSRTTSGSGSTREASMLVLPSLEEGFGMTAVEAMQAGVPVVASDRGALPEVVGDAGIARRPDERGRIAGGDRTAAGRAPTSGGGAPKRDGRRRAQFSWSDERGDAGCAPIARPSRGGGRRPERQACSRLASTRASCSATRPASAATSASCCALDRPARCGRAPVLLFAPGAHHRCRCRATHVETRGPAGGARRHLVGADRAPAARFGASRSTSSSRRPTPRRSDSRAAGGDDPRHLVPRAPRVVPAARGAAPPLADAARGAQRPRWSSPTRMFSRDEIVTHLARRPGARSGSSRRASAPRHAGPRSAAPPRAAGAVRRVALQPPAPARI